MSTHNVCAVDALIDAEALTCKTCGGVGGEWITTVCGDDELVDRIECPACNGTGRRQACPIDGE